MTEIDALLAKADRYCKTAHLLAKEDDGESSVSRSYYAMFYAAQAILLTKGITASSHGGVIAKFSELFVKTGVLPCEMSSMLAQAQAARQLGDYDSQPLISSENAFALWQKSTNFVTQIRNHLNEQNSAEHE